MMQSNAAEACWLGLIMKLKSVGCVHAYVSMYEFRRSSGKAILLSR